MENSEKLATLGTQDTGGRQFCKVKGLQNYFVVTDNNINI
jgi:hypothetical protein